MKVLLCVSIALQGAVAFPSAFFPPSEPELQERAIPGCSTSALCEKKVTIPNSKIQVNAAGAAASKARNQGGALTPVTFFDSEEQKPSITGEHAWIAPKTGQIRGPCPGLNAAANHGYLPRDGVASLTETILGLGALYGMSADLAGFLAAYGIAIDGDVLSQTWSIGGPPPTLLSKGLLGKPQGISWSHNKYEGDSSISRCDAYTNNGDGHSLSVQRFKYAYESGLDNDRYTFDKFAFNFAKNTFRSEMTNPLYFAPLFSTTLVSPAAYNFVIAMMSNHTAEKPDGYLDGEIFKTFFSVTGKYPNFKWNPGYERVPDNWWRRPTAEPYTAHTGVFGDLASEFAAYPHSFRFGGNTNGVNTYTGIDIGNFTNGAVHLSDLSNADNLACFLYQNLQQAVPDFLQTGGVNPVGQAMKFFTPHLDTAFGSIACKKITKFNNNNLNGYPGRSYNPKGPATSC